MNFIRPVSVLYILDEMHYDGWFGLELFASRDSARDFMVLSRDNLRLGTEVVAMLTQCGSAVLRRSGENGPEMARLVRLHSQSREIALWWTKWTEVDEVNKVDRLSKCLAAAPVHLVHLVHCPLSTVHCPRRELL